jgi:predicted transcriptional regulator
VIPIRYHAAMAMTLRLSDEETELLRQQAEREHRSMQEVVRLAILDRVKRDSRSEWIAANTERIMEEDADLLRRLAQ